MAEVEEGGHQPTDQEQQCDQAAYRIKTAICLRRQQMEKRINLAGVKRQEQPLAGADQGGEKNH